MIARAFWFGLVTLATSMACSSGDTSLERVGGPIPDPSSDGGADPGSNGGSAAGDSIPFCAALEVLRAKCQRCHGDPLRNGAPAPFLTYEDTQAQYFKTDQAWWQVMQGAVERDLMPYVALNKPPTSLMPPVEPLTDDEKATLLGWLEQGARPEGGTDCR